MFKRVERNSTNSCIHNSSFLLARHREPRSINAKLLLPILPIGIVAYALPLLLENLCRNSCIYLRAPMYLLFPMNLISLYLSFNCQAGVFMGFSITSAVFGGIIIICYSLSIAIYRNRHYYYYYGRHSKSYYDEEMALTVIILILGIVEFAIGIWASVCVCLLNPCQTCCYNTQQQQQQQQQQVRLSKVIAYPHDVNSET